jgi:hypothetical protein
MESSSIYDSIFPLMQVTLFEKRAEAVGEVVDGQGISCGCLDDPTADEGTWMPWEQGVRIAGDESEVLAFGEAARCGGEKGAVVRTSDGQSGAVAAGEVDGSLSVRRVRTMVNSMGYVERRCVQVELV